jgi:hypothetical protein
MRARWLSHSEAKPISMISSSRIYFVLVPHSNQYYTITHYTACGDTHTREASVVIRIIDAVTFFIHKAKGRNALILILTMIVQQVNHRRTGFLESN